ncbi:hypothetical protein LZF95_10915 [Algoriphagus sp. AGSA1]|nr:hypothetical protein [Algoriphagus sp. AGSA1]
MSRKSEINFDSEAFILLFREVVEKCFGHGLTSQLNENQSKILSVEIEEKTGLIIGYKTLKNYSVYICEENDSKTINPSLSSLDTLARYALNAPFTTDAERLKFENHFPYWNNYQRKVPYKPAVKLKTKPSFIILLSGVLGVILLGYIIIHSSKEADFIEEFNHVDRESLETRSWKLISPDTHYWKESDKTENYLTLFTLDSDNWPESNQKPEIKNLLVRPLESSCFKAETHIEEFFPRQRWQQAGLILMEDLAFNSRALRISIAYNDFFGGFDSSPEIILQGVQTNGLENPEEVLHYQLFEILPESKELIRDNLRYCKLRIEKKGDRIRVLVATSSLPNAGLKEVGSFNFEFTPKYIGIFAIKGREKDTEIIPVKFDHFSLQELNCH